MQNENKIGQYFGHAFFLILTILGIIYAKERCLFNDSATLFFRTVNYENFQIPHFRYSNCLFQWPIVIGAKLHLPLTSLMYIFSLSYILMNYLFWLISRYFFKNQLSSLMILFSLCCGVSATFYHMVGEALQGLVFCSLFFASLHFFKNKFLNYLVPVFWMLLAIFSHPSVIICVLFVMGFYSLIDIKKNLKYMCLMLLPFVILVYIKKTYFFSAYDNNFTDALLNSGHIIQNFWQQYPVAFFNKCYNDIYWQSCFLFVIAVSILLYLKAYLKLSYILFSVIVFCIINNIAFAGGDSDMMMERIYLPGIFMILFPYLYIIFYTKYKYNNLLKYLALFIICNSTYKVYMGGKIYADRIRYVEELVDEASKKGYQNWVVEHGIINDDQLLASWGLATETLLISAMKDYNNQVNICKIDNYKNFDFNNTLFRASPWNPEPIENLNKYYFNLKNLPYKKWKTQ